MEDSAILDMYFARSEQAITETDRKYGPYCYSVAYHILENRQDSEESVNDTYYSAWRGIPPRRPRQLGIFLGRITRNLAIDRWRRRSADKRGAGAGAGGLCSGHHWLAAAQGGTAHWYGL